MVVGSCGIKFSPTMSASEGSPTLRLPNVVCSSDLFPTAVTLFLVAEIGVTEVVEVVAWLDDDMGFSL